MKKYLNLFIHLDVDIINMQGYLSKEEELIRYLDKGK